LMAERGVEFGAHRGLGWIPGEVARLAPADPRLKVPHMGWNRLEIRREHPLFAGLEERPYVYFLHSYAFRGAGAATLAETDYGARGMPAVGREKVAGRQLPPEKAERGVLARSATPRGWRPRPSLPRSTGGTAPASACCAAR